MPGKSIIRRTVLTECLSSSIRIPNWHKVTDLMSFDKPISVHQARTSVAQGIHNPISGWDDHISDLLTRIFPKINIRKGSTQIILSISICKTNCCSVPLQICHSFWTRQGEEKVRGSHLQHVIRLRGKGVTRSNREFAKLCKFLGRGKDESSNSVNLREL